jgi:hypothetical protein
MNHNETVYRIRDSDVSWVESGDEIVVLSLVDSEYLNINEAGAKLWSALTRGASRSDLAALLQREYDLTIETAERDVDSFVTNLDQRGLVRVDESQTNRP